MHPFCQTPQLVPIDLGAFSNRNSTFYFLGGGKKKREICLRKRKPWTKGKTPRRKRNKTSLNCVSCVARLRELNHKICISWSCALVVCCFHMSRWRKLPSFWKRTTFLLRFVGLAGFFLHAFLPFLRSNFSRGILRFTCSSVTVMSLSRAETKGPTVSTGCLNKLSNKRGHDTQWLTASVTRWCTPKWVQITIPALDETVHNQFHFINHDAHITKS